MTRFISAANRAAIVIAMLLLAACIVHEGEPHPLYPNSETPRPASAVARLFGPIAAVDGQEVSKLGKSFSLLPGCHIVRLLEKVGEIDTSNGGGFVATLGHATFALRMKAGYTYEIEIGHDSTVRPVNQMTIQAWERSADGSTATPIAPARSGNEIDDCRKWTPTP